MLSILPPMSAASEPTPPRPSKQSNPSRGPNSGKNGRRAARPSVSSGLARRRSPTLLAARGALDSFSRVLAKDPLSVGLLIASVALAIAFFTLLSSINPAGRGTEVPLSQVVKLAKHGQVSRASILDYDNLIEVYTAPAHKGSPGSAAMSELYAAYPSSGAQTQALFDTLTAGGASVSVNLQSGKAARKVVVQFLIPILLLVCLFALLTRLGQGEGAAGGIAAFSRFAGRGRKRSAASGRITFGDVAGASEAVAELREIRDYLAEPSRYLAVGAAAPKGVLLVGPPGTGKTLLAKAVAGEADAAFFSLSGSEFVESLVGVGAARVRDLFRKARRAAPAIVFIDELDAAGRKRGAGIGQGNDEREQTLNQLLVEMDGFAGDGGLVVMAATNRPDILDPALLRPGRFDRQVTVDNPDVHGRVEILELYAQKRPLAHDVSLEEIARQTAGFSGAELANVVNEAALLSVREGRGELDQHTIEEAIDRVLAGPAKKHILSAEERWLIAIHEASHAVATEALGHQTSVRKLSIIARGRQLGTAASMLTDRDQVIVQEPDMQRQLIAILAGQAGERLAFGCLSSGVNDDLHAATTLARSMVTSYGMSQALGPLTIGEQTGEVFLGASLQDLGSVGPSTLDLIDRETERIILEADARASRVLELSWSTVEETAAALLDQETLSGVALEAVLSTVRAIELEDLRNVTGRPEQDRRGPGREQA
jgi:cell division protease FtsH